MNKPCGKADTRTHTVTQVMAAVERKKVFEKPQIWSFQFQWKVSCVNSNFGGKFNFMYICGYMYNIKYIAFLTGKLFSLLLLLLVPHILLMVANSMRARNDKEVFLRCCIQNTPRSHPIQFRYELQANYY